MNKLLRAAAFGSLAALAAIAQTTSHENEVRDRGQTPVEYHSRADRTLHGMLVDSSCADRSSENLAAPPLPLEPAASAATKTKNSAASAADAKGITVNPKVTQAERADVTQHMVQDLRSRQSDPTCAVTGGTHGFAVLLDNGHLYNVDEGGNTILLQAIQSSAPGRAMLNGTGPGVKPKVTVTGRTQGDRLFIEKLDRLE